MQGFVSARKKFAEKVLLLLKKRYKSRMQTARGHTTPWELLVATILSAQAQDTQVNKATVLLFKDLKNVTDYARLKPSELYKYTKSIGLYRNKSKNIIRTAKMILKDFDGKVPKTMEQLTLLPGVGRKTANIVLSNSFGINEGIAIDTHCIVVSKRLGLTKTKNPKRIEMQLTKLYPKSEWSNVSNLFIALGRDTCTARVKYCNRCVLKNMCPSSLVIFK